MGAHCRDTEGRRQGRARGTGGQGGENQMSGTLGWACGGVTLQRPRPRSLSDMAFCFSYLSGQVWLLGVREEKMEGGGIRRGEREGGGRGER